MKAELESEVRRALTGGLGNDRQRRILAAMVTINECSLESAEQALASYIADVRARGYENPCISSCDVNHYVSEAGRFVRQAQRAARRNLQVWDGGAEGARVHAHWTREQKRTAQRYALIKMADEHPVANNNDPARKVSPRCTTFIQRAAVRRAKERRDDA